MKKVRNRLASVALVGTFGALTLTTLANQYVMEENCEVEESDIQNAQEENVYYSELSLNEYNLSFATYEQQDNTMWFEGYVTSMVEVKSEPNDNSQTVGFKYFNDKITYFETYDCAWCGFEFDGQTRYIKSNFISTQQCTCLVHDIAQYGGFKAWMGYNAITDSDSLQYLLQNYAQNDCSGCRTIDGRYCIALGTRFNASIGQFCDLILENGTVIKCIVGDIKSNAHTDVTHTFTSINNNLCCSEFIVNSTLMDSNAKRTGDVSYMNDTWNSPVRQIIVYDYNYFNYV